MAFFSGINLGSLLSSLFGLNKGGTSAGSYDSSSRVSKGLQEVLGIGTSGENYLGNYIAGATGSRLTDAQREANSFSSAEAEAAWSRSQQSADIAWQRELDASNSQYQRRVADMQAAGLNPMLAATGGAVVPGASAPTATPAGSTSPGAPTANLGSIISAFTNMFLARSQSKNIQSQTALNEAEAARARADAANKQAETAWRELETEFNRETFEERAESIRLANSLSEAQTKSVYRGMSKMDAEIANLIESAKTEESKRAMNSARALLDNASARQIVELLPYEKAYKSASTEAERQAAVLSAASAAYKNGLIDEGYLDLEVRRAAAAAGLAENDKVLSDIKTGIREGHLPRHDVSTPMAFIESLFGGLAVVLDNFNPLANIFK